ncbi:MAG TPA: NAD(P)-binding domain-containing protein [Jatrophihabitans sp.]|nr:NAD(P)-binding domain-containing protein [Jatrophihabitans sp.]
MRIGVIGTGNIGGTVGTALARAGHEVTLGSRHPSGESVSGVRVADVAGALAGAEVVLLALPAGAVGEFLAEHAGTLAGKLVIDATNRIGAPVANAAAQLAEAAPDARYARAFNTLGWENFADPVFDGEPADLFFSCAQADHPVLEQLIADVGLRPAYLGEGKQDVVDGALPLWFALVQAGGGNRRLAFRVLRK